MSEKSFIGRVISKGNWKGKAVVSHQGVNTLATFQKSALKNAKEIIASDQNNPDIFGLNLTGIALCLPKTIGSTTGGLVLQTICSMGINPSAMLFSEHIDSLAASGIILANVWENSSIIAIDNLGIEFLNYLKTGMDIEIKEDGTVTVFG
jgi:predicted aconitase with swiveling domain